MTAARSLQLANYDTPEVSDQVVTIKPASKGGGAKVEAPARQVQATIDFKPWIEAKDAAVRLRTDYRHFLKKVRKQLVGRGMAMQSKGPNGVGQLRWFVKRDYDTRLIDGPAGLVNRFPDEFYEQSEEKRTKALACAACVRRYRELLTKDSRPRDEWIDSLIESLKVEYPQLSKLSPRTLYRWHSSYSSDRDIMVFVDKRGGDSTDGRPDPAACDFFRSLYLHVNSLDVSVCHAMTQDKADAEGWRWCNYRQAVRLKNKIPLATRVQHRDPERYDREFSAYLKMDPDAWKPGELWQGDHCVLDQWVRFDGGVIRPWLTAWLDWKSRKIVGWQLSESPSSATIRTSFLRALQDPENHGGPDIIHIDNGRDYKCEEFTGSKFTKQSVKLKRGYAGMPEFKGLYEHLGFQMIFAIPGNSRGKGRIERWFGTMHGQFDKRNTHSYAGHDADSRPKDLDARLKHERDKVPTFEEVQQRLATYIDHYNYSVEHGKKDMRGASPAQVFSSARKRVMVDPDALKYFALPQSKPVLVRRKAVTITPTGGVPLTYATTDPRFLELTNTKQYVRVAYNPDDLFGTAYLMDAETGSLICAVHHEKAGTSQSTKVGQKNLKTATKRQRRSKRIIKEASGDVNDAFETIEDLALEEAMKDRIKQAKDDMPPEQAVALKPVETIFDGQSNLIKQDQLRRAVGADHHAPDEDDIDVMSELSKIDTTNDHEEDEDEILSLADFTFEPEQADGPPEDVSDDDDDTDVSLTFLDHDDHDEDDDDLPVLELLR